MGIESQSDKTGTYTIHVDGTYRIMMKGGQGAGAKMNCEPSHHAMGGSGGFITFDVDLKQGDVVSYSVANGGCQMSNVKSIPDDYYIDGGSVNSQGHILVGADGRDTVVKINGVEYAIAYGGDGGVRMCLRSWFEYNYKTATAFAKDRGLPLKTEGWTTKTSFSGDLDNYDGEYDDPALGGKGGGTWYASGKGITVLAAQDGENGKAEGDPLSGEYPHAWGFLNADWMNVVNRAESKQGPGFFAISLNHDHEFPNSNSTCIEAGTGTVTCSLCGGVSYGYTPPHGHNFQPVEASDITKCKKDQLYYERGYNSPSNNVEVKWDGRDHWWYAKQCQYCKQYAEPYTGYNVRYNEGSGPQMLDPELKSFDTTYTPYTAAKVGWKRKGYHISHWEYRVTKANYTVDDKDNGKPCYADFKDLRPNLKATYNNLPANNEWIVDLYAVWVPNPYILRIHENFTTTGKAYKDYQLWWDNDFQLPQPLWKHDALCYGYDLVPETKVGEKWRGNDYVRNLTELYGKVDDRSNPVIDIYTIWDLPPQITLKTTEIHLSQLKAAASSLNIENGTISRSDLEALLMGYVDKVYDYEWSCRYSGSIQPGEHNGYTFKIASFEPAKIKNKTDNDNADTYYVTFQVTDDANQSAQAVLTLFVGDKDVDILVR